MGKRRSKTLELPEAIADELDALAKKRGGKGQQQRIVSGALLKYFELDKAAQEDYSLWGDAIYYGRATLGERPQLTFGGAPRRAELLTVYQIKTGPFTKGSLVRRGEATIWTAEDVEPMSQSERRNLVPVLARTAAGLPMADSDLGYPPGGADEFVEFRTTDPHAFGLRLVGDSMEPHFHEGDIVIFGSKRGPSERMAGVMIFKSGGVSTFKIIRLCTGEGYSELIPLNEKYPTERIAIDQMGRVLAAIGVVSVQAK